MLNIGTIDKHPVAFKAPRNYTPPQTFNPNTGLPIGRDAYVSNESEDREKRKEKYMKYIAWGAIALGIGALCHGGAKLLKVPVEKEAIRVGIERDEAMRKQAEEAAKQIAESMKAAAEELEAGVEPTRAQQELGYKTTAQIKTMFEDVSKAKSLEELEPEGTLKEQLDLIIDQLKRAKTYEEFCLALDKCILLYGPPGTGKTAIVLALCKKLGIKPFLYDIGKLKGGYQGAVEYNMDKASDVFLAEHRAARAKDPNHISILFFDECDELFRMPTNGNGDHELRLMQRFKKGFNVWKDEPGIIIIGNTNCMPEELESAMENRWKSVFIDYLKKYQLKKAFFKHFSKGGKNVAENLKKETPESEKMFDIMENHHFSYRDLDKRCYSGMIAPKEGEQLSLNDIVKHLLNQKTDLRLTNEEIKTLEGILK